MSMSSGDGNNPHKRGLFSRFLTALSYYSPAPHRIVFSTAFTWHSLAVRYFIMTPFSTLRAVTHVRPITFTSAEILQYLGGLNIGYAILALQGLFSSAADVDGRKRSALVLSIVLKSFVIFLMRLGESESDLVYDQVLEECPLVIGWDDTNLHR